jgi:hypothetical protein
MHASILRRQLNLTALLCCNDAQKLAAGNTKLGVMMGKLWRGLQAVLRAAAAAAGVGGFFHD